ncbi:MAG: ABC transporter ATP-binding protein [Spirochaetes bacterium]|nr:ABC transporter ATP-binding protein [Spirochaetota bacterium]
MNKKYLLIEFSNVYYYFSKYDEYPILEDISFNIFKDDFISIIGPNGSGKTTLAKLFLGIYKPSSGSIKYFRDNNLVNDINISYVPQFLNYDPLYPILAIDIVLSGRLKKKKFVNFYKKDDIEFAYQILKELKIENLAKKSFKELSGGQKQKILIARALASKSEVIILDEPTSNLDRETQIFIYEKLQKLKEQNTIILISHDIDIVPEISDKIFCLNRKLIMHQAKNINLNNNDLLNFISKDFYNCNIKKVDHKSSSN